MPIGFGFRPDSVDPRDSVRRFSGARRARMNGPLLLNTPSPRDQVGNSCVANAWCHSVEITAPSSVGRLSAQALYWLARRLEGMDSRDDGSQLRLAAKALAKLGVPRFEAYPDDIRTINQQPPLGAMLDGWAFRLGGYYRIPTNTDSFKGALSSGYPIVAGWPVGPEFCRYDGSDRVLSSEQRIEGYHAMVIVGYSETDSGNEWTLLNSWGTWGLDGKGLVRVDDSFIGRAIDCWTGE